MIRIERREEAFANYQRNLINCLRHTGHFIKIYWKIIFALFWALFLLPFVLIYNYLVYFLHVFLHILILFWRKKEKKNVRRNKNFVRASSHFFAFFYPNFDIAFFPIVSKNIKHAHYELLSNQNYRMNHSKILYGVVWKIVVHDGNATWHEQYRLPLNTVTWFVFVLGIFICLIKFNRALD